MREITIGMAEELSVLFAKVFNEEPWRDKWTEERARERLTDIINTPRFFGMSEYADNKMIGLIMGREEPFFDGMHFQIMEFCVDNQCQGQGIGKKMLQEFIEILRNRGIDKYYLITAHGDRTEGFYKKNGFHTIEEMCLMSN